MTNFFKDTNTKPLAIAALVCLVLLTASIVWFIAMGTPAHAVEAHEYYALTAEVVEIDRAADIVTCEDSNGNLWEFYGAEDWETGDCASLLMDSMGTPKIEDDEICGATFGNWNLSH